MTDGCVSTIPLGFDFLQNRSKNIKMQLSFLCTRMVSVVEDVFIYIIFEQLHVRSITYKFSPDVVNGQIYKGQKPHQARLVAQAPTSTA